MFAFGKRTLPVLLVLAGILIWGGLQTADASGTITVKGSALNGWALISENAPAPANGQFESGPGSPPAGIGSVRLVLGNSSSSKFIVSSQAYAGVPISKITELKYSTYRRSADAGNLLAIALAFDVDYDLTDTSGAFQGRLVYEPYNSPGVSGTILQNTWYNWDTLAASARWWASGAPGNATCPQATPCTWAQVLSTFPNAGIRAPQGFLHLSAGSNWANFDGNADDLIVGVNGDSTTYDFEPETGCATPCIITVKPSSLMGWTPIQETPTGSASFVTGPGTPPLSTGSAQIDVVNGGEYVMSVAYAGTPLANISQLQYSNLRQSVDAGNNKSVNLQFDVDYDLTDANSTYQGRLVYQPQLEPGVAGTILQNTWYTWNPIGANARWWATGGAGAAICTQGSPCSWATVLSNWPNAGIHPVYQELGFKIGSGEGTVKGNFDAFIIGVSSNNVEYDFEPDTTCTTDCYVNWTSGNDAYDGNSAATARHSFVSAIGSLSTSGTVHAANGTYIENVLINKALTLLGASQAGVIIRPALSNPNCSPGSLCSGAASNLILVQADNVTIHDLTVDGDNLYIDSGIVRDGDDINARNGIIVNTVVGNYTNLEVYKTNVKNVYLRGIQQGSSLKTFNFHDNYVENVQGDGSSIAMFNFGSGGTFKDNVVDKANDAISANHSTGTDFNHNIITHAGSGVHTDNMGDSGGTPDTIHYNEVSDCTTGGYGVWVFVPYKDVIVDKNTVTNCDVGLAVFGGQGGAPAFTYNNVTGNNSVGGGGVYVTTDTFGFGDMNVVTSFSNTTIDQFETGMFVDKTGAATLTMNSTSDTITGSTTGIEDDADLTTSDDSSTATGNALLIHSGGNVTANNVLTLIGNAHIESGGTLAGGTTSTIKLTGNWTKDGTFTANSGKVQFNGAAAQTIGGTSGTTFHDLDLANTGADITSNVDLVVNGQLAMNQDSNLELGSHTLTMAASSNAATAGTGQGDVIGTVTRSSFSSGTSYNFGSPFVRFGNLTFTGAPSDISINLVKQAPQQFGNAVRRLYTINVNGGTGVAADLRLHYRDDALTLNGNSEATLTLWRENGGWGNEGETTRDATDNWVEQTGITAFSPWTMASGAPTASDLSAFDGKANGTNVRLDWQTASESSIVGFNVWRARGKSEFAKVNTALLPAKNPGSAIGADYSYTDKKLQAGSYQYKLQVETSAGTKYFSSPVKVSIKNVACANTPARVKLTMPKNKALVNKRQLTLHWNKTACATHYELTLRADAPDGTVIAQESNLKTLSYKTAELKRGKTYYWTVQACSAKGCGTARTWQFTIKPSTTSKPQ